MAQDVISINLADMSVLQKQLCQSRSVGQALQRAIHETRVAQVGQAYRSSHWRSARSMAKRSSIVVTRGAAITAVVLVVHSSIRGRSH